jgi:hypothetical protein
MQHGKKSYGCCEYQTGNRDGDAADDQMTPNVRDQRRRAVGAPLAWESLWEPLAVRASGVTTSDDRCIA